MMPYGTMRAAVLTSPGEPLRIAEVPVPVPGPGEILIKLEASGVCHTDVHIWRGHLAPVPRPDPFILGHEGVGAVVMTGPGVTDWAVGDRAGAAWLHDTCGSCPECTEGHESFCHAQRAHGFNVPGTFAEYVVADSGFAARIPDGDAATLAPLMCAGLTAYGAIQRAELRKGETCAVFGCGGLGLYAVQLATRLGAHVIAVDRDETKLLLARSLGAQELVKSESGLASHWKPARAHVCINFAPTTATWDWIVSAVRPRGRIIAAAMVSQPVDLNQEWLTASGVNITGTSVGTRAQMSELMALHEQDPLVGEVTRISLDEATDALEALDNGTAKGRFCIEF
jgi:alcohol dehydrogenase, propanol-preferring